MKAALTISIAVAAIASTVGLVHARDAAVPFSLGQHLLYPGTYSGVSTALFSRVRIWGNVETTWNQIEAVAGAFDFTQLDQHVRMAHAKGFDILYTLGQTPTWASARPGEKGNMGLGAASEPADMGNWARYVRAVANRYRGRIRSYEIMNEPRIPEAGKPWSPGFFSGSASTLADMTRIAAEEIKRVDPGAIVVCPSMDGSAMGLKRLDSFLSTGAGKYCDAIGFHFYLSSLKADELRELISGVRSVMTKHGLQGLPVWNTETGILVLESGNNVRPKEKAGAFGKVFDSASAARFAAMFLIISYARGVQRTYWFAHDSSSMGSTGADKRINHLNGFGKALGLINSWLSGNTLEECVDSAERFECRVVRSGIWIGSVYWGGGVSAEVWRGRGFKEAQTLDGETLRLQSVSAERSLPQQSGDVLYLVR